MKRKIFSTSEKQRALDLLRAKTLREVARETGCSYQTLINWKNQKHFNPDIADALIAKDILNNLLFLKQYLKATELMVTKTIDMLEPRI